MIDYIILMIIQRSGYYIDGNLFLFSLSVQNYWFEEHKKKIVFINSPQGIVFNPSSCKNPTLHDQAQNCKCHMNIA